MVDVNDHFEGLYEVASFREAVQVLLVFEVQASVR